MNDAVPLASLIISSRNRPRLLRDAVRSVLNAEQIPAEVVVIDQSDVRHPDLDRLTTDRSCDIRYIWTDQRGTSRGRNMGIGVARHPILAFIDDDCLAAPTWFESITRALARAGDRAVVTGQVVPGEPEVSDAFAPGALVKATAAEYAGRQQRDVLLSNNMAFFRRAIDEVGLFDEHLGPGTRFPSSEDNDLGFRLLEAGYRILYVPEAIVTHRAWRKSDAVLPLYWGYGRGQGAYYAKHLRRDDKHMLSRLIWEIGHQLRRASRHMRHRRREAAEDLVFGLGVVAGAAEWVIRRPR